MSKIKSFRGKIADDGIDTISLHTNNGSTGYRITKLQIMPETPGTVNSEQMIKIYSVPQTTATATVDFNDQTLLAVAYIENHQDRNYNGLPQVIIFDNTIFNQDIYVTHANADGTDASNYYIELEQIKLDLNQNTVATLKDIRNIEAQ